MFWCRLVGGLGRTGSGPVAGLPALELFCLGLSRGFPPEGPFGAPCVLGLGDFPPLVLDQVADEVVCELLGEVEQLRHFFSV